MHPRDGVTRVDTVRMYGVGSLDGYVFADHGHAREWLAQRCVDPSKIRIQPVSVSPPRKCRTCGGAGYHQTVVATGPRVGARDWLAANHQGA